VKNLPTWAALTVTGCLLISAGCDKGYSPPVAKPEPAPVKPEPSQPKPDEVVVAGVGVGKKGSGYDKFTAKAVATPAKAYFNTKQKIVFEIQIPHAVTLYANLYGNGKGPQSHEEFMQKIITDQKITLPELPEGHTYEWDAKQQLLMVRRPASK